MIPAIDHPKWKTLLTGNVEHNFHCVPAGLMLSRIRRELVKDDSEENYNKYLKEAVTFFQKYEKILKEDIDAIFV